MQNAEIRDAKYVGAGDPGQRKEVLIQGLGFHCTGDLDETKCQSRWNNSGWIECEKLHCQAVDKYEARIDHEASCTGSEVRVLGQDGIWSEPKVIDR